ncbi:MAG: aminopeptidase family protein P, partial [Marinomonas sp.]
VSGELTQHLGNAVTIRDRADFESALSEYSGKSVSMDPGFGVAAIASALEAGGASVSFDRDPCILPKAVKNASEQQGHRDAQARDGAAVARFLHWLEETAPSGEVTELSAAAKLRSFRAANKDLRDLSFRTISGAAHHAALPHYSVDEESNIPIPPASIYLVDSGGQYPAGTTDITRTVWIGTPDGSATPSEEMRDRYTRVLKGHIALDQAIFPAGTAGCQLDTFARQHLWQAGVDYAHGTGHGVGSFLAVHEGPQRIAKSAGGQAGTDQELMAGMILSNEPGYYKTSEAGGDGFGIRIENLVLVEPRDIANAEGQYFGFETLTFVPIDRKLVDKTHLSAAEIAWWNDYHEKVEALLAPQLDGPALEWVKRECKPL